RGTAGGRAHGRAARADIGHERRHRLAELLHVARAEVAGLALEQRRQRGERRFHALRRSTLPELLERRGEGGRALARRRRLRERRRATGGGDRGAELGRARGRRRRGAGKSDHGGGSENDCQRKRSRLEHPTTLLSCRTWSTGDVSPVRACARWAGEDSG